MLVLYQFADSHAEAQLDALSQSVNGRGDDEGVHVLCACTDDEADETDDITADEEPATTKKITQSSRDEEHCALCERSGDVDPCCVLAGTNVLSRSIVST